MNFITEQHYNQLLGKMACGYRLTDNESANLCSVVATMEQMLDDADEEDFYGTQGWRYHFGWED